jgi:hypothetical protein
MKICLTNALMLAMPEGGSSPATVAVTAAQQTYKQARNGSYHQGNSHNWDANAANVRTDGIS